MTDPGPMRDVARGRVISVVFVLRVRPDRIDEYVAAHPDVWPEMLDALRGAGFATTRSSAQGTRCSATSRPTTSPRRRCTSQQQDVCTRWQDPMAELLEERVPDAGPPPLEEVFRLD